MDILDPALLRPGRFDRQIYVPAPDIKGRRVAVFIRKKFAPGMILQIAGVVFSIGFVKGVGCGDLYSGPDENIFKSNLLNCLVCTYTEEIINLQASTSFNF